MTGDWCVFKFLRRIKEVDFNRRQLVMRQVLNNQSKERKSVNKYDNLVARGLFYDLTRIFHGPKKVERVIVALYKCSLPSIALKNTIKIGHHARKSKMMDQSCPSRASFYRFTLHFAIAGSSIYWSTNV